MTKNTKIALGCGGAGCLGLILIIIIGVVLVAAGYVNAPGVYSSNRNYNSNSNSNYNYNSNTNPNSNSDSSSTSSTLSNDEKHKLFQAALATNDNQLRLRVLAKIGLPNGTGAEYSEFAQEHFAWALNNMEFIETVSTAAKGRAYVEAHLDD